MDDSRSCMRWLQPSGHGRGKSSSRAGNARADQRGLQSQRPIALQLPPIGEWRNGDDVEEWLIEAIDGATEEVLVAVQELSLPRVAQALIAQNSEAFALRWCWDATIGRPGVSNEPAG